MTGIWGIITTIASRVGPLAIGSSFCSHHLTRSVSRTGLSGKLFHRSFPSSLHYYSTKSTIKEILMRGMESHEDEEKFEKAPKEHRFAIEERNKQQTLLLTNKYKDEILNVEVLVRDVEFSEDDAKEEEVLLFPKVDNYYDNDDNEKTNQECVSFVAKVTFDFGGRLYIKLWCTAYRDKIYLNKLTKALWNNTYLKKIDFDQVPEVSWESYNIQENKMIENLHETYLKFLKVRGIKPEIIYYLHELKVELNKFKRSFAERSQQLPRRSVSTKKLYQLFLSSLFDYCGRWHIDIHTPLHGFSSQKKQLKQFEFSNFCLSRKDKAETIHVEIIKVAAVSAESGNDKKKANLSVVFSFMKKGLFLSLYCTVYTDKISLDSLRVEENSFGPHVGIHY